MSRPDFIFWDNDGVLVDTETLFFEATASVLARKGIAYTLGEFRARSLRNGTSAFDLLRDRGIPENELQSLREDRNQIYAELIESRDVLVPGVRAVLNQLAGSYRMAVVTTSLRRHFELIHRRTGLIDAFEFALCNEQYEHAKPHPEPYERALARARVPATAVIAVEDSLRGLAAARAAGIKCLVVPGTLTDGEDFKGATAVLQDVRDVPDALRRMEDSLGCGARSTE